MESRMEKYYKEETSTLERSKRNEKLYKEVSQEISNLDNLPVPDNANEIDLNGLKEIIYSRDEYRKAKEEKQNKNAAPIYESREKKEERVYDINVLLENAKNEVNKSNAVTNKKVINANFLTGLEDANIPSSDDATVISSEVPEEHQKDSNTDSLPLDILMDLKGSDNTIVTDPIVKDEVTMIRKIKEGETFYSGSFNFTKKDFENKEDDEDDEDDDFLSEKEHSGLKIFFLVLGIIILVVAIYLIITTYIL